MLSSYLSQPIYSVSYPGSPRYSAYTTYPSSRPEVRYCRALAEYLSAEGEYEALLRSREQAKLRARVEEALRRQERARLLRVEISRARREQQAREIERTLAKALSREEVSKDRRSFRDIAPVICGSSGRPCRDTLVFPFLHAHASPEAFRDVSAVQSSAEDRVCRRINLFGLGPDSYDQPQPQHHANEDTKPDEYFVPNLESLLQKVVGDEEVQDVARAILRRLTPETGVSRSTKVRPHSVSSLNVSFRYQLRIRRRIRVAHSPQEDATFLVLTLSKAPQPKPRRNHSELTAPR